LFQLLDALAKAGNFFQQLVAGGVVFRMQEIFFPTMLDGSFII
jgi:hypothetical protein